MAAARTPSVPPRQRLTAPSSTPTATARSASAISVREHGLTYGRFIDGLNKAGIEVDRKVLSDMAINQPEAFGALVASAKASLEYLKDTTPNAFEGAVR